MTEIVEIDDIVLDIPEPGTKGFLRRQINAAERHLAIVESQNQLAEAKADIDNPSYAADPKKVKAAYKKLNAAVEASKASINASVNYIMGYVKEPADKAAAREVILDLSEDNYRKILSAIQMGSAKEGAEAENPTE